MQTVHNRISNEQRAACAPITSSTPTGVLPVVVSSDFYRQDKKAKMIPVPTFNGTIADWHSFWCRFSDYISNEKLSFQTESFKIDGASDLVQAAITNGDSFSTVERRLKKEYEMSICRQRRSY